MPIPIVAASRRSEGGPSLARLVLLLGVPLVGLVTVVATLRGSERYALAGWLALSIVGFLLVRPAVGVLAMTAMFMFASYPSFLRGIGFLTLNNLLGLVLGLLLAGRILYTREFPFLRVRQVQLLIAIGIVFLASTAASMILLPYLKVTVGKLYVLDRTRAMTHDFVTRLIYLIFILVFLERRSDLKAAYLVIMLSLFVAVPSAILNYVHGSMRLGFRAAAAVTAGTNPNRLAMICLMEITMWWFFARMGGGRLRRIVAWGAIGASLFVLFLTGSRSGLLGLGVLALALQAVPGQRVSARVGSAAVLLAGALAFMSFAPQAARQRMLNFFPGAHQVGATSNQMREQTLFTGWQMFLDYPLTGIGLGNFREVSRQVYHDPYFRPPHNSFLWAAAEGGIFCVALYVWLLWTSWKDVSMAAVTPGLEPQIHRIAVALRLALALLAFFSLFADLWLTPITYVLLGLSARLRQEAEAVA